MDAVEKLDQVILFSRDIGEIENISMFSVSGNIPEAVKSRQIVRHVGQDSNYGKWHCSKDGAQICLHIMKAKRYMQILLQENPADNADELQSRCYFFKMHSNLILLS